MAITEIKVSECFSYIEDAGKDDLRLKSSLHLLTISKIKVYRFITTKQIYC